MSKLRIPFYILIVFILSACTSPQVVSTTPGLLTISPESSSTLTPTETPTLDLLKMVLEGIDVTVYAEPFDIYGNPAWFSQEIVTIIPASDVYDGDMVKILGYINEMDWMFIETADGYQGWITKDDYPDPDIAVPSLPFRLSTGTFYWGSGNDSNKYDDIEIINDTQQDAYIVLVFTLPPDPQHKYHQYLLSGNEGITLSLYVRTGESFSAYDVYPGGPYRVFIMFGDEWYPNKEAFSQEKSYWQLVDYQWFTACVIPVSLLPPGTSMTCDETINLLLSNVTDDGSYAIPISETEFPKVNHMIDN